MTNHSLSFHEKLALPHLLVQYRQDMEKGWWTAILPNEPSVVSQGKTLENAFCNVRNALSLVRTDAQQIDLVGGTLWDHRKDLSKQVREAAKVSCDLRLALFSTEFRLQLMTREAVKVLRNEGCTYREAGALLGITHARVAQIVNEEGVTP